jgi:TolB protein
MPNRTAPTRPLAWLVAAALLAASSWASAQPAPTGATTTEGGIEGIIRTEGSPPIQRAIAVPDAMNLGTGDPTGLEALISRTLRRDLDLAGVVSVIPPTGFFFDQHADGMTSATVNFQNWFSVGAQGLAKTSFRVAGNQVRLDFRLFDVDSQAEVDLPFEPVTVGFDDVVGQVHEFANQIVEHYTGYRGPFGTSLVLEGRGRDGSREIYAMTVGGDGPGQLTSNGSINTLPRWAGNGEIAWTSYVNGTPEVLIGRGNDYRVLSSRPGTNTGGSISPDGTAAAVALTMDGNSEIYLLDPQSGEIRARLTDNRAEDVDPVWSPSGNQLAFVSDRSGGPQIYVMNADGSDQRRVTFAGTYNTTPDWAPDGRRIAFTGRDSHNHFDVFIVDLASSYIERVTQDQGDNEHPTFSPNGQYLIFSSTREGGAARLWISTVDGNFQRLLTRDGAGWINPVWHR